MSSEDKDFTISAVVRRQLTLDPRMVVEADDHVALDAALEAWADRVHDEVMSAQAEDVAGATGIPSAIIQIVTRRREALIRPT